MIVNSKQNDAHKWLVVDLDNRTFIEGVLFANDESGELERMVFNKDGSLKSVWNEYYEEEILCKVEEIKNIKIINMETNRSELIMNYKGNK